MYSFIYVFNTTFFIQGKPQFSKIPFFNAALLVQKLKYKYTVGAVVLYINTQCIT